MTSHAWGYTCFSAHFPIGWTSICSRMMSSWRDVSFDRRWEVQTRKEYALSPFRECWKHKSWRYRYLIWSDLVDLWDNYGSAFSIYEVMYWYLGKDKPGGWGYTITWSVRWYRTLWCLMLDWDASLRPWNILRITRVAKKWHFDITGVYTIFYGFVVMLRGLGTLHRAKANILRSYHLILTSAS